MLSVTESSDFVHKSTPVYSSILDGRLDYAMPDTTQAKARPRRRVISVSDSAMLNMGKFKEHILYRTRHVKVNDTDNHTMSFRLKINLKNVRAYHRTQFLKHTRVSRSLLSLMHNNFKKSARWQHGVTLIPTPRCAATVCHMRTHIDRAVESKWGNYSKLIDTRAI